MARILLLNPPLLDLTDRDLGFRENLGHIGLAYIAAVLLKAGHEVRVIDAPKLGLGLGAVARQAEGFAPLLVGITAATSQILEADAAARAIKARLPEVPIVIGGYHASGAPQGTLSEFAAFDYLVEGEGELSILELAEALAAGGPPGPIPGVWSRQGAELLRGPARQRIADLDALPFPAFQLFPYQKFTGMYSMLPKRGVMSLAASRGCPFQCNFCFQSVGAEHVQRSPESVLAEIERDLKEFSTRELIFVDETFTLDRKRTIEILEGMLRQGYPRRLSWICQSRVDRVDRELLKLMKRAGCRVISFGVESGNQEILESIKKSITIDQARDAIRLAREEGIKTHANYIIGHPGEDQAAIRDTLKFAVQTDSDWASFAILVPFPGTEVERMAARGEGGLKLLTRDWSRYGKQVGNALEHDDISRAQLESLHRSAYRQFYLRPSKALNLLSVLNPRSVPIYIRHSLTSH